MASALGDHVSVPSDLDLSLDLTASGQITDILEFDLDENNLAVTTEAITQDTSPSDEGGVSTPNSTSLDAPRPSAAKRKSKIVLAKPRRVRTGCLTCRERHLKCDEALHRCQNCRKSGRVCRRGIRLNFIDIQKSTPPHCVVRIPATGVTFRDESRLIASEYVGGFERYPPEVAEPSLEKGNATGPCLTPSLSASFVHGFGTPQSGSLGGPFNGPTNAPAFYDQNASFAPFRSTKEGHINATNHTCLNNPEEVYLLQVFVEEVGLWMDSMDAVKHFTHILPFHALEEPMLLKALLACGARHLFHVDASYGEEKAAELHNVASQYLLRSLQDPDRDSALCATTAILLNIYELMSGRPIQGMSHIAGARALIKECHWNAKTPGLGGACFWLNVSMELLSCLHFNWTLSWDPDTWGVELDLNHAQPSVAGNEEAWTHQMVFICAKIANFRSLAQPPALEAASDMRISQRYQEWCTYNEWCDQWARAVPRSMMPLGYIHSWQTNSKSVFPQIWLIKRSTIIARLLYHTARILLTKTNPVESEYSAEMQTVQQSHARDICGIVAHSRDRGVASLSIRFLAIAAECLATREAQQEALGILEDIIKQTGWEAEHVKQELQEAWGWSDSHGPPMHMSEDILALFNSDHPLAADHTPARPKVPAGVINPLMATADFLMENHPYQDYYVAPHRSLSHYPFGGF
ncbi:transcriptional regulator family: Fungal Specific TF [Aspergillus niger]|nr:transcriptional regulator family: Fungal Specific TF [Aspergillus niger]KAI2866446.1 transcriptional regulator family: Fungal Specific TF [Aspergillus niger]KAI2929195.1 transcriptional regulator family: Fungal Specific TF [Aspergillus niger]KAI2991406.1 transcriptional regulator family: Fungal Specific TF [Aspergillus niger]